MLEKFTQKKLIKSRINKNARVKILSCSEDKAFAFIPCPSSFI